MKALVDWRSRIYRCAHRVWLLQRGYQVSVLNRGVHPAEFPSEVERIYADPHWRENLTDALEGKSYDLVMALYGRLRLIAEVMKGRHPSSLCRWSSGNVQGWMTVTNENPFGIMEESPVPWVKTIFWPGPRVDRFSEQVRLSEDVVMQAHSNGYYNATHFRYPIVYGPRSIAVLNADNSPGPRWKKTGDRPGGGVALCRGVLR